MGFGYRRCDVPNRLPVDVVDAVYAFGRRCHQGQWPKILGDTCHTSNPQDSRLGRGDVSLASAWKYERRRFVQALSGHTLVDATHRFSFASCVLVSTASLQIAVSPSPPVFRAHRVGSPSRARWAIKARAPQRPKALPLLLAHGVRRSSRPPDAPKNIVLLPV